LSSGIIRIVRLGSGAADQYLFALTNLIPSIAVARASDIDGFAAFSACFLVYVLLFGAAKAAFAEPAAIRSLRENSFDSVYQTSRRLVSLYGLILGPLIFALVIGMSLPQTSQSNSSPLVWLALMAVGFPFHALHDVGRTILVAARKPVLPLISDTVWFGIAALGFFPFGFHPVAWASLVWVTGGIVACCVVCPPLRPEGVRIRALWSSTYSFRSLTEYMMQSPVYQGSVLLSGVAGSPGSLAALRGGTMLFRPVGLLVQVHRVLSFGASAKRSRGGFGSILFTGVLASTLGTFLFAAILWFLPKGVGHSLLGPTWSLVHAALLPLALAMVFDYLSYVFVTDIKAHGIVAGLLSIRIVGAIAIPLFTVLGALSQDPTNAAWGFCAGQAVGAAWVARRAITVRRDHVGASSVPE